MGDMRGPGNRKSSSQLGRWVYSFFIAGFWREQVSLGKERRLLAQSGVSWEGEGAFLPG
jgi:hypothetical protein